MQEQEQCIEINWNQYIHQENLSCYSFKLHDGIHNGYLPQTSNAIAHFGNGIASLEELRDIQ